MTHVSPEDGPPAAFLSHASEDKGDVAEPLGRELARLGITPWLDKWEIRPGDSLVQKLFDEGLATVDAVIVLVSLASVGKPWVREELDSAMVRRITRGTRLIPVRLDGVEMPEPLKHLVWISMDRSPAGVRKAAQSIADTLHGHDPRPAVGPRPGYTAFSLPAPGLTNTDAFLLMQVIRQALGGWHTKLFDLEPIKAAAKEQGISDEALIESLHALGDGHYLNVTFGPADNVFEFELTRFGYETGIGAVIPDVERIRRQVISALVNELPTGESVVEELAKQFDAPILVVEQILEGLREQNLISRIRTLGGDSVTRVSPTLRRRIL